eukprot:12103199-Alexandrium_andersonii.AAC.1
MAGEMEVWIETASSDGCGKPLKGKFQTCSICGSVDLCPQCFPRRKAIRPEHEKWQRGSVPPP